MTMTKADHKRHKQDYKLPYFLNDTDERCENCMFVWKSSLQESYSCGIGKFKVNKIGRCKNWRAK